LCSRTASLPTRPCLRRSIPTWAEGDTFLAGTELVRFRILAIDAMMDPDEARDTFHAVWVVEPL
jgi:hypothetical protein